MIEKIWLDKPDLKTYNLIKWLNECRITDKDRPVLECIYKSGKLLQATNAFTLVCALLDNELAMDDGNIIPDGLWKIDFLSKKAITLTKEYGTFPDTSFLLKRNKEKDPENKISSIALNGNHVSTITKPFDYFVINLDEYNTPVQLLFIPADETFPDGKYIGSIMPFHYDYNFENLQNTFYETRLALK